MFVFILLFSPKSFYSKSSYIIASGALGWDGYTPQWAYGGPSWDLLHYTDMVLTLMMLHTKVDKETKLNYGKGNEENCAHH